VNTPLPSFTVTGYAMAPSGQIVANITALPVPMLDPWGGRLSTMVPVVRGGQIVAFGAGLVAPNGAHAEVTIFDR
jgi:hypothetical protein